MNGVSAEGRTARKRALTEELVAIRTQKADVLRQIQQIAKRQKTGGMPTKASELLASNNKLVLQMEQRNRAEKIWMDCHKIVQELLKNQQTKLYFGDPVKESYAPNYYTVIKNPMDLGTIKGKVEGRRYHDVYEFRDDVRLTFNNCRIFNPPGNHVRTVGDQASEKFEKKWQMAAIEFHWEAHKKQCELENAQLEADSKSLPDKLREVTAELQELTRKVEAHGQPLPQGPGREMTFEEKRKLSHSMGTLSGEHLVHVLQIIANGASAPVLEDEDEYELDIDALDAETCWQLQAYVDSVLADQAARQPGVPPMAGAPPAAAAADTQPPAAGAAPAGGAAAAQAGNGTQQQAADGTPAAAATTASDSDEGVGSKGGAGSTFVADQAEVKQRQPHELSTFVSATGPGAQTQILKNATQKKDVQLQNAGAWASLTAAPAAGAGGAGAQAAAPVAAAGAGAEGGAVEDDNLWTEFQGREAQQLQAEEAKRAAEEAERKKKEAEMEAMRREAQEAEARKRREAEEKAAAEARAREEQRQRELQQFQSLAAAAEAEKDPDILKAAGGGGHDSAANLADLGLQANDDEGSEDDEDVPMEDI